MTHTKLLHTVACVWLALVRGLITELDTGQLLSDGNCVTGTAWVHHRTPHDSSYRPHTMALRTPAPSDRYESCSTL